MRAATSAVVATLLASSLAEAAIIHPIFTVNSTADVVDSAPGDGVCETATANGVCTLRAAVMEANQWSGALIVVPVTAGTYVLNISRSGLADDAATGDLDILADMTIVGGGASSAVVDASLLGDRILSIGAGRTLTISGLTLRNGTPGYNAAAGGGVYVSGTLHISNCIVTGCQTDFVGGGISIDGGTASITDCVIDQNIASSGGGGIVDRGTLTISSSTISRNQSPVDAGGGITAFDSSTLTISGSAIWGNVASFGGGIATDNTAVTIKITDSTISGNMAKNNGGGIYNQSTGSTTLCSVTVADNAADELRRGRHGRRRLECLGARLHVRRHDHRDELRDRVPPRHLGSGGRRLRWPDHIARLQPPPQLRHGTLHRLRHLYADRSESRGPGEQRRARLHTRPPPRQRGDRRGRPGGLQGPARRDARDGSAGRPAGARRPLRHRRIRIR